MFVTVVTLSSSFTTNYRGRIVNCMNCKVPEAAIFYILTAELHSSVATFWQQNYIKIHFMQGLLQK